MGFSGWFSGRDAYQTPASPHLVRGYPLLLSACPTSTVLCRLTDSTAPPWFFWAPGLPVVWRDVPDGCPKGGLLLPVCFRLLPVRKYLPRAELSCVGSRRMRGKVMESVREKGHAERFGEKACGLKLAVALTCSSSLEWREAFFTTPTPSRQPAILSPPGQSSGFFPPSTEH